MSSVSFCSQCGNKVEAGERFCSRCGAPAQPAQYGASEPGPATVQEGTQAAPARKRVSNRAVVIIAVAVVAVAIVAAVLHFIPSSSLVGTWEDSFGNSYTFSNNGTFSINGSDYSGGLTYSVSGNQLTLTSSGISMTYTYRVGTAGGKTTLTLTYSGYSSTFYRQ